MSHVRLSLFLSVLGGVGVYAQSPPPLTTLYLYGPTTAAPGSTASLNLIGGGTPPAATQFTLTTPAGVTNVTATAGPAATRAMKSVQCSPFTQDQTTFQGSITCTVSGLNQLLMTSGIQVQLKAKFSPTVMPGAKTFTLSNLVASDGAGVAIPVAQPLTITVAPGVAMLMYPAYGAGVTPYVEVVGFGLGEGDVYQVTRDGGVVGTAPFSFAQDCGPGCYMDEGTGVGTRVMWGGTYTYALVVGGVTSMPLSVTLPTAGE
jgi:hypothetical protein